MKLQHILTAIVALVLSACATQTKLSETDMFKQFPVLLEAKETLGEANGNQLALYSPQLMQRANTAYDKAIRLARSGNTQSTASAKETIAILNAVQEKTKNAKYMFEEVLAARQRARDVNAQTLVSSDYAVVERALLSDFELLEQGEETKAKKNINQLKNQFLDLELKALKTNLLSFAKEAIEKAEDKNVNDFAPRTMLAAADEYQLALGTLEADRTDIPKANVHAAKAIWLTEQATAMTETIKSFKNANFDEEQKQLWYQEQLARVVAPINSQVPFNLANKEVVRILNDDIAQLTGERQALVASVDSAKRQNTELELSSKMRESALQESKDKAVLEVQREKEEAVLAAQLELEQEQSRKREIAQKFAGIQSLFMSEEATVYRQLDNVLIRAQGFAFKSGSSEIESSNFVLLNKIIESIKRFPNSNIMVSGHTDSVGSEELNLELSKRRAQTVANFITQVGLIPASRVEFGGHGKEKPVASNETVAGRAENRRVEVLIMNKLEN